MNFIIFEPCWLSDSVPFLLRCCITHHSAKIFHEARLLGHLAIGIFSAWSEIVCNLTFLFSICLQKRHHSSNGNRLSCTLLRPFFVIAKVPCCGYNHKFSSPLASMLASLFDLGMRSKKEAIQPIVLAMVQHKPQKTKKYFVVSFLSLMFLFP